MPAAGSEIFRRGQRNCSTSQVSTTEVPDAKPQLVYTNARTGFSLEMGDPDNWSVIPAREDEHGGKILTFPPGIVTSIPLSVLTDDAAVAFVCTQNVGSGRPSLWVFRVSQNFGTVEAFVAAETGRLLRTGTAASIFWASKYIPYGDKGEPNPYTGNGKDVTLSKIEVSPDHRSALLLWKSPYTGDDFDVVARALIEANDAYYVVAIMGEANNPTEIRINNELRKMLETFKAL